MIVLIIMYVALFIVMIASIQNSVSTYSIVCC